MVWGDLEPVCSTDLKLKRRRLVQLAANPPKKVSSSESHLDSNPSRVDEGAFQRRDSVSARGRAMIYSIRVGSRWHGENARASRLDLVRRKECSSVNLR